MAMSRWEAGRWLTSSPSIRISPEVGNSSPAIMRKVVVLPQPEGPSSMKNSPSLIVKVEPCTAVKAPNSLRRLRMTISAKAHSGKWLVMMNITVPVRVTRKDQV